MKHYDPLQAPVRDQWLDMDEQERIRLVETYHRKENIRLPNLTMHAGIHTIVENQLAEGLPVPCETLSRLMRDGLDRHDAIHAIGCVLADHIFAMLNAGVADSNSNEQYHRALRELTVAMWRSLAQ